MKKKLILFIMAALSLSMMFGMTLVANATHIFIEDTAPGYTYTFECYGYSVLTAEAHSREITGYAYTNFATHEIVILKNQLANPGFTHNVNGYISNPISYGTNAAIIPQATGSEEYFLQLLEAPFTITVNELYSPEIPPTDAPEKECNHNYEWRTISSATKDSYGTEGFVCTKCGSKKDVRETAPINDYVNVIMNTATTGDTVNFDFGPWNSYPRSFIEKIASKNDVTYVFRYTYNGNTYELTIKPGAVIPLDCEWYGPKKMAELFETRIVE